MEFMRAAVRPAVTAALVAAQIGLAFAWAVGATNAPDAFAAFAPFTMTAMVFWFNDRSKRGGA